MKCTVCGNDASGNFCSSCGASLASTGCVACGASLVPGARFCTQCGAAAASTAHVPPGAEPPRGNGLIPWYAGAAVLLALALVLALPLLSPGAADSAAVRAPLAGSAGTTPQGTPPPLTGTPREQADRLFNRIMQAHVAGDSANVEFFMPMGLEAYSLAAPLDDDGLYHVAMLHTAAGNYDDARATADSILEGSPQHLLALAVAGDAAERAGDAAAARDYYGRFLDAYDSESGRSLTEYQDHGAILPEYLGAAHRVTGR